jgi:ribosomal peptide maturation radical SAM protein 1
VRLGGFDCGRSGGAILIVPPFADLYRPSLAAHILQACARRAGVQLSILYANLLLAQRIGEGAYEVLTYSARTWMLGERVFSRAAFGTPPLGHGVARLGKQMRERECPIALEQLLEIESAIPAFCDELAAAIAECGPAVVGSSTTFEQTAASVALLSRVKSARAEIVTVIGGANCDGEMALGIASLTPAIDFVFSGECETAFPDFLKARGRPDGGPADRIVQGAPCEDLDGIPTPDFTDYFAQLEAVLPDWKERQIWLSYETSRGCWWGQKQHCTFCGLNGEGMEFRQKSPHRVLAELKALLATYPTHRVVMTDNIMPYSYFGSLLPALAEELPHISIFWEQKSNLSLEKVRLLRRAGVDLLQPGIEALSSRLLKSMKKGVLARQHVALLRYARSAGVWLNWNILFDFPGDLESDYEGTLELIPLLAHLNPPAGVFPLALDRFSPYFKNPGAYGISNLRPIEGYAEVFPAHSLLSRLAYHFQGDYSSACRKPGSAVPERLNAAVREWRARWDDMNVVPPSLEVAPLEERSYLLMDTRNLPGTLGFQVLNGEKAHAALAGGPREKEPEAAWALEAKVAVELDGWLVPLAVADHQTIERFEPAVNGAERNELIGIQLR